MAQQVPFSTDSDSSDPSRRIPTAGQSTGRYSEQAGTNFIGGGVDSETGNLRQGSAFQAERGLAPTKPPETPAPAQPSSPLGRIDAPAPPAMLPVQPVAPYSPPKESNNIWGTIATVGLAVVSIFCYAAGTRMRRADGGWINVEDVDVGDELALGGLVLGVGKALCEDLYEYKGTRVSGSHAVFEDGRFVRVSDSPNARPLKTPPRGEMVFPIVTEAHLLVLETHVAADFAEVDDGLEKTATQRLEAMNANTKLLRVLDDIVDVHVAA